MRAVGTGKSSKQTCKISFRIRSTIGTMNSQTARGRRSLTADGKTCGERKGYEDDTVAATRCVNKTSLRHGSGMTTRRLSAQASHGNMA